MRISDRKAARHGLTRREVIFLAAVLIGGILVLWPYLAGKRRDRDRVSSFQNLQQWGIALNLHLIDNNNQLPEIGSTPIGPEPAAAWYNVMPTYLSRDPLGSLPPEQRPQPGDDSLWSDAGVEPPVALDAGETFFAYGMNRFLQPDPKARSYTIYDLSAPGSTIFLTETAGTDPGVLPREVDFRHRAPEAGNAPLAYILFCDGHVAFGSRYEMLENSEAWEPAKALAPVSWVPFVGAVKPEIPGREPL